MCIVFVTFRSIKATQPVDGALMIVAVDSAAAVSGDDDDDD